MNFSSKKCILISVILLLFAFSEQLDGQTYSLESPDEAIQVTIEFDEVLSYSVQFQDEVVLENSPISMTLGDGTILGRDGEISGTNTRSVNTTITRAVPEKRRIIPDVYNELVLNFSENYQVEFRAYADGFAYRFVTEVPGDITVQSEQASFRFAEDHPVSMPIVDGFLTHQEELYTKGYLGTVSLDSIAYPPVLLRPESGTRILITESGLEDYPGLYLTRDENIPTQLNGLFPAYPAAEEQESDRTVSVTEREDFLARTTGDRAFPWRIVAIMDNDADILTNDIVYRLAKPLQLNDTTWIRPGKVAWDWWNANNIYGVPFESGVNTATYKYYIDFAANYGLEYVIFDEGWSNPANLSEINANMDMEELTEYANEKDVGIILWCVWLSLENDMQQSLDQFEEWGIKGIKVDFMQRDDQKMVNYYWEVAREAAERQLLVNFHGAYKPSGLRRAYPNVITREGVLGLEHSKWSQQPNPDYNLELPFIRNFAGPMDYTPGAMINAQEGNFRILFTRPMSMGTRIHQLAMYVVFESPLQMLADSPSHYLEEPEMMNFLSQVPTIWDDTQVIDAQISDYVVIARQSGDTWYVAAMTDWTARNFQIDLSFLGSGSFTADVYSDGINASRYANDFSVSRIPVDRRQSLRAELAQGGGWVAIITSD